MTSHKVVKKAIAERHSGEFLEEESGKNPHAVALGRLGGKIGGKARAKVLTKEQRKQIAVMGAKARWHGR